MQDKLDRYVIDIVVNIAIIDIVIDTDDSDSDCDSFYYTYYCSCYNALIIADKNMYYTYI